MEDLRFDIRTWCDDIKERFKDQDLVSINELLSDYEEALYEIKRLKKEIKDIKQDIEDNYKPVSVASQVGVSEFGNEINF